MTWEELVKANETIKTTNIKGKDYAEVNQRIKAFRMCYPEGFIDTQMVSNEDGVCIFRATVGYCPENSMVRIILGTGTAYEKEGSTFINKTSYIENCETSAVGRALGMAGFGIDTSVASYEEVSNAIQQQAESEKPSETHIKALQKRCIEDSVEPKVIYKLYKVKEFAELTMKQYNHINQNWDKIKDYEEDK